MTSTPIFKFDEEQHSYALAHAHAQAQTYMFNRAVCISRENRTKKTSPGHIARFLQNVFDQNKAHDSCRPVSRPIPPSPKVRIIGFNMY
jgi:hypothetical protein